MFFYTECAYVTLTPLFLSYNYYKKFKDIESYLKF